MRSSGAIIDDLAGVVGIDEAGEDAGLGDALRIARVRRLAHDRDVIVGRAGEAVVAPERPRIDHRHLDDQSLRPALRDLHAADRQRRRIFDRAGEVRRDRDDHMARRDAELRRRWTIAPLSFHSILRTGAPSLIALPSLAATRRATVCVPPITRSSCAGPNSASMLVAGADQPAEMQHGDFFRACARHRADFGGDEFARAVVLDVLAQPFREGHGVEPRRVGMLPRRLRVDRLRDLVDRDLGLLDQVAAGKAGVGVVLDAVILVGVEDAALQRHQVLTGRRIRLAAHLLDQRVEALLRRADPLPAEIDERAVLHPHRPGAAADAPARFQHHDFAPACFSR